MNTQESLSVLADSFPLSSKEMKRPSEVGNPEEDNSLYSNEVGCVRPHAPETMEEAGLTLAFVQDLAIKHLYRSSVLNGRELALHLHLPYLLIEPVLEQIVEMAYVEKRGGKGLGGATDRFALTERGKSHARDLLLIDTYVGPAPVPLERYSEYIRNHSLNRLEINETLLRHGWRDFILDESLFTQIGPAICSGKSCFLYGPPGTGKTTIAKAIARLLDERVGGAAIPHALIVGDSLIRLFDPVYHRPIQTTSVSEAGSLWLTDTQEDRRWVACHRPCVMVGGELTLDMLDLRFNSVSKFYEAPLQLKANAGVFIIDDFGRQLVQPRDLLNRWIVPLEDRIDFLTLHTGKKFSVPFEQLVVFATNLDPMDLADEAFLRRIRYKIFIGEPSVEAYKAIFDKECNKKNLQYDSNDLDFIIQKYYRRVNRPMRACDPRDMTDLIVDHCLFNGFPHRITREIFDTIASVYMRDVQQVAVKGKN